MGAAILEQQEQLDYKESFPTTYNTCVDPESFVRGGPTLTTFFVYFFVLFSQLMRAESIQINLLAGHHRALERKALNAVLVA